MTRKQMEARVDDIAAFTELGDYLLDAPAHLLHRHAGAARARRRHQHRPGDPPARRRHRRRRRRVPGQGPLRLNELVERSGILVFASHSDEFLADLCDTAIWMDQGQIREHGPLREVLHHYKGRDVLAELESR
jgi:ABC-2 type transport system ATP-binding protein